MRSPERGPAGGAVSALVLMVAFAGCLGDRPTGLDGDGGSNGEGGLAGGGSSGKGGGAGSQARGGASGGASAGTGGAIVGSGGAGGAPATGGASATGGMAASGGATASGGAKGTGGLNGTGGIVGTGGAKGTGGAVATGGVIGTGGVVATGGVPGTGGVVGTGGVPGTGGIVATGGVPGTGGIVATGGVTGTGGAPPVCSVGQTRCVNSAQAESCKSDGQWGLPSSCMYACVGSACGGSCTPGTQICFNNSSTELCGSDGAYATPVSCPLASPPNPICSNGHCAYHAGVDQQTGTDSLPVSYAIRFKATANTTASRLGMFGTATGLGVRLGLYSESTLQMPSALLSSTSSLPTAAGAIEGALAAPQSLNAGTYYWIAAIASTTINIGISSGGEGFSYNTYGGWPTLPSAFPATGDGTVTTETAAFYVVLQDQ
jgi:hypothetical protein